MPMSKNNTPIDDEIEDLIEGMLAMIRIYYHPKNGVDGLKRMEKLAEKFLTKFRNEVD